MLSDKFYSRLSMSLGDLGLKTVGKLNVPIYRATKGRLFGKVGRAPVLLLTTTGRRSGQKRTAPVVYMPNGEDVVVIGSNAGNERVPAWSLNLKSNQEAEVELGGERRAVRARVAQGDERTELWKRVNETYSGFDDYAERTNRDIAVFVLEPR